MIDKVLKTHGYLQQGGRKTELLFPVLSDWSYSWVPHTTKPTWNRSQATKGAGLPEVCWQTRISGASHGFAGRPLRMRTSEARD